MHIEGTTIIVILLGFQFSIELLDGSNEYSESGLWEK